jgi:ribokinase
MPRVVCAGHVNWDVTLRVDRLPGPDDEASVESETGAGGGSAANVASALVGLDVPATLLGSVGDDDHGRAARRELREAGIDCSHVRVVADGTTARKYLVVATGGDAFVLGRDGANEAFSARDLPDATLDAVDHLHLTSQSPGTAIELAERAAAADVTVSFDPGRRVADRAFAPVLAAADVVFLNDREAACALDDYEYDDGAVVRKRGTDGAEVRTADRTYAHAGFDVDAVDSTGAGDAFAAGFLAARLDGADVERALAVANACGAVASSEAGARAVPTWDAVRRLLD